MRRARIIEEGGGYYHVMSRIVDRRMVIDDSKKGILRRVMREMEGFSGVEIVTYAILDNHFHILLSMKSSSATATISEPSAKQAHVPRPSSAPIRPKNRPPGEPCPSDAAEWRRPSQRHATNRLQHPQLRTRHPPPHENTASTARKVCPFPDL